MDVLSDVVTVARTGRPRSARVRWHAPWAQEFAAVPGALAFQLVLEGRCWLLRPDTAPLRLERGDVLFLPRGGGHVLADSPTVSEVAPACTPDSFPADTAPVAADRVDRLGLDGPATVLLCGAYRTDPSRTHPLLHTLPELLHLPSAPADHPELHAAVGLLAAEANGPQLGTDAIVPALLDTLLVYLLRRCFTDPAVRTGRNTRDARNSPEGTADWATALGDPALHALHTAPGEPWTVAGLAARAGLSRAAFARRFAATVGLPPLRYLTWWRMASAARMLRETDAPLRTVAARLGYTSEFAFAAAFKRAHGRPPGAYRRSPSDLSTGVG
ncbi:AraC family transcriptional regulator [Kitasatospora phosalacinea]|uniref:AraC family transcriptional regulator n=1 Tax=Kitasatospora phosalacinea TaxID=2065 RepID=A0A9W6V0R2_9ACTN|nr:AraC family transcriptional regulator [Kitasatospora phosalacinea]GLW71134.1 AraC family transcriptional regulator [Kitasatospora phosalacinea]